MPFSRLVYDVTRWMPSVYRFEVLFRWRGGALEKNRIEQAIRYAVNCHTVFQMRVDWHGNHYPIPLRDALHGQFHYVKLYVHGEDLLAKVRFDRILGDLVSCFIAIEDVLRIYNGNPVPKDNYWTFLDNYEQRKREPHYLQSKAWLEREFVDESVPVRPTTDRRWLMTLLPPKAGLYEDNYTDLQQKIEGLSLEHFFSYEGLFSLCVTLAIADYCGTDEAALTWAYEGRETPEEQRIFGSLHRDVPFKIRKSTIDNRESAIRMARNQIRQGIAHSDYPYTLMYPYTKHWNYAVNVLRGFDVDDLTRFTQGLPIEIIATTPQKYAYALLDVEIHEKKDSLKLVYRYSATHYKPESISRFATLVRKYVEWLID